jgi:hypothetical protein
MKYIRFHNPRLIFQIQEELKTSHRILVIDDELKLYINPVLNDLTGQDAIRNLVNFGPDFYPGLLCYVLDQPAE